MIAAFVPNVIAWVVAASAKESHLPIWPAWMFIGLCVFAVFIVVAALQRWWPFQGYRSVAEMLDDRLREGQDIRQEITLKSDHVEAGKKVANWSISTSGDLHNYYPAATDVFVLASGTQATAYGNQLIVDTLNAKLKVLRETRTGLGIDP